MLQSEFFDSDHLLLLDTPLHFLQLSHCGTFLRLGSMGGDTLTKLFAQHNPRKDQMTRHFSRTEVLLEAYKQAYALHMLKWFWPVESVTGCPQR